MTGVPYIRFYGDDWLSGTMMLSPEERGVLITIVALTAAQGGAPKLDYNRLPRWLGCTRQKAKKTIEILVDLGKLTIVDGLIVNTRSLKELEKAQVFVQKQTENASKSRKKARKFDPKKPNENNENTLAKTEPNANQPEPEPEPEVIDKSITHKAREGDLDRSTFVSIAFERWNEVAKKNGLALVELNILAPNRRAAVVNRLRECGDDPALVLRAIDNVAKNSHWLGKNDSGWTANFDWVFRQENFTRALEMVERKTAPRKNDSSMFGAAMDMQNQGGRDDA